MTIPCIFGHIPWFYIGFSLQYHVFLDIYHGFTLAFHDNTMYFFTYYHRFVIRVPWFYTVFCGSNVYLSLIMLFCAVFSSCIIPYISDMYHCFMMVFNRSHMYVSNNTTFSRHLPWFYTVFYVMPCIFHIIPHFVSVYHGFTLFFWQYRVSLIMLFCAVFSSCIIPYYLDMYHCFMMFLMVVICFSHNTIVFGHVPWFYLVGMFHTIKVQ